MQGQPKHLQYAGHVTKYSCGGMYLYRPGHHVLQVSHMGAKIDQSSLPEEGRLWCCSKVGDYTSAVLSVSSLGLSFVRTDKEPTEAQRHCSRSPYVLRERA